MITFTQLREGSLKTAVFSFGRFNPPTIGHELLINKVSKVASRNRADAFIFPSGSQDAKKNPLDYAEKIKSTLALYKREKEFYCAAFFIVGKREELLQKQSKENIKYICF